MHRSNVNLNEFCIKHPIFTIEEFTWYLKSKGSTNTNTKRSILEHHLKKKRIAQIRRGLYYSITPGSSVQNYPIDPFLIASKLTDDAIISHHSALEVHGYAHSVHNSITYTTNRKFLKSFSFRGIVFKAVKQPKSLISQKQEIFGVQKLDRKGQRVNVTGLERTLVDILDRPDLTGEWEEIWRSLESIEYLNLEEVLKYVLLLGNAFTVAKVAFYLEQHKQELLVEDSLLNELEKYKPKTVRYMLKGRSGQLLKRWNLIVPVEILNKDWRRVS